jgi:hypothetical protein
MVRTILGNELRRMQAEIHYPDTCVILSYNPTYDSYNDPVDGYTTGSATSCNFDPRSASERRTFEVTQVSFDASIHLPTGTVVDEQDKIRITKQYNDTVSFPDYSVVGDTIFRPTHIQILLEEVHA